MTLPDGWEMVIGLEVHCELATRTKLFCCCPNSFGDEPNVNTCPTCLGLPGSLPVLNEAAVEMAMRLGRALACDVERSVFARKNYFYPDQPKDYQVSQYDLPTNEHGVLELPSGLRVGITRAHIEEDTGKLTHVGGGGRVHDAVHSLVDYNRSGVPLVEIVSEADMRTSDEAKEYVSELRAILLATGVSDAKMEEGSMRVDANVSVNRAGEPWGTRCEIKNLNSLRSLGRAIDHEALRQIDLLDAGENGAPGDPPLGRGRRTHGHPPREGGRRRLPLLPRARPRAPRALGGGHRPDRRGPPGAARGSAHCAGRRRRDRRHGWGGRHRGGSWPRRPGRRRHPRRRGRGPGAHPRRAQPGGRRGRVRCPPSTSPRW